MYRFCLVCLSICQSGPGCLSGAYPTYQYRPPTPPKINPSYGLVSKCFSKMPHIRSHRHYRHTMIITDTFYENVWHHKTLMIKVGSSNNRKCYIPSFRRCFWLEVSSVWQSHTVCCTRLWNENIDTSISESFTVKSTAPRFNSHMSQEPALTSLSALHCSFLLSKYTQISIRSCSFPYHTI